MLTAAECVLRAEGLDARAQAEVNPRTREMFGQIAEAYRDLARQLRAGETPIKP